jgi:hypothetical protein
VAGFQSALSRYELSGPRWCKAYLRAVKKDLARPGRETAANRFTKVDVHFDIHQALPEHRLRHLRGDADSRQLANMIGIRHVQIWHAVLLKIIIAPAKVWPLSKSL